MDHPPSPTRPRPGSTTPPSRGLRRLPRSARWGLAAVLALALAHLVAQAAFAVPAVEGWLRARLLAALAARVGGAIELGPDVDVDRLYRVSFGPLAIRGPADGVARIEVGRAKVRASLPALLAGRLEAATVRLDGVRVELEPGRAAEPPAEATPVAGAEPGGDAAAAEDAPRAPSRTGPRALPTVHLKALEVTLRAAGRTVAIPPVDGRVRGARDVDADVLDVALWRGDAAADLSLRREASGAISIDATLARVPARRLPEVLLAGLATPTGGELAGELHLRAPADRAGVELAFRLEATRLAVEGARLGPEPIGPMELGASGRIRFDAAARKLLLEDGALDLLGALRVRLAGSAALAPGIPIALAVDAERIDYRALADALPPALALPADAPRPGGTFDLSIELGGPILRPSEWTVAGGLDLSRLRKAARAEPQVPLRRTFTHRPRLGAAPGAAIRVGPESPDFVAFAELPDHVVRAVTTSEDAGFFWHQGFDLEELKNAFAAGAERGKVVRGGSTITQQLAKNLYLGPERTLARKVREAVLTIGLEATVPKARLLEIYLNVAEWGPGLHGVAPAARHYFDVDARSLTPKQAAFLASIIPNPVRLGSMAERGLSPAWDRKLGELLARMTEFGVLSEDELAGALAEPLGFAGGAPADDAEPSVEAPPAAQDGDDGPG